MALIEQSNAMYGGTCINIGCIPTKHWFMTHSSTQILSVPYSVKMKWLIFYVIQFHNLADMPNIDVIDGQAEFINNHSLRVHRPEGNLEIHGEKIFI